MLASMVKFAGFERATVAGIPVLWCRDSRFKTFRFTLFARRPFAGRAAARSLLPALAMQGTQRDPDRPALARRMENLYGAAVSPATSKQGEVHELRFSLDCVAGEFLPGRPDQLGDGLTFAADLLLRPRLEDGAFPQAVFHREQRQAVHNARAVFDDRGAWAHERALAVGCAGEPIALPEHGGVTAIEALTAADPERARVDFLRHCEMVGVAAGALPEAGFTDRVAALLAALPERRVEAIGTPVQIAPRAPTRTVERVDLQQSKLVLIFRVPWSDHAPTWMARALFTSMLGGGTHSRLFREVREKRSLAYYAHAVLDRYKGLLTVHVGLDEKSAAAVEAEVGAQLGQLQNGNCENSEIETARAGLLSSLAAVDDSITNRIEFTARQWFRGQDAAPAAVAADYARLAIDDVVAAASGIWLDHSFLLAPLAGGGAP